MCTSSTTQVVVHVSHVDPHRPDVNVGCMHHPVSMAFAATAMDVRRDAWLAQGHCRIGAWSEGKSVSAAHPKSSDINPKLKVCDMNLKPVFMT